MSTQIVEKVKLPSNGLLYPERLGIGEYITIRPYTTADEKGLMGSSGAGADLLVRRCIVEPKIDDISELYTFDEMLLFIRLRAITLGSNYSVTSECPRCRKKHKIDVNLNDLEVKYLEADMLPFTCKLKGCEKEITLKYLTEKEKREVDKKAKKYADKNDKDEEEESYIANLMAHIDSVSGVEMTETEKRLFIEKLSGADSADLREAMGKMLDIGLETVIETTCPKANCGYEYPVSVIGSWRDFFRI